MWIIKDKNYLCHGTTWLAHFNPYHDKDNGQFTTSNASMSRSSRADFDGDRVSTHSKSPNKMTYSEIASWTGPDKKEYVKRRIDEARKSNRFDMEFLERIPDKRDVPFTEKDLFSEYERFWNDPVGYRMDKSKYLKKYFGSDYDGKHIRPTSEKSKALINAMRNAKSEEEVDRFLEKNQRR